MGLTKRVIIWNEDTIKKLTKKQKKLWFDVYNNGLLKDRGYNLEEKTLKYTKILSKIEKDYYKYLDSLNSDSNFVFYAIYADDTRIYSVCRLIKRNSKHYIEGLETHRDYYSQGFGCNILRETVLECASRGIKKIYSEINPQNIASVKTHEKLGFKKESDLNQRSLYSVDSKKTVECIASIHQKNKTLTRRL